MTACCDDDADDMMMMMQAAVHYRTRTRIYYSYEYIRAGGGSRAMIIDKCYDSSNTVRVPYSSTILRYYLTVPYRRYRQSAKVPLQAVPYRPNRLNLLRTSANTLVWYANNGCRYIGPTKVQGTAGFKQQGKPLALYGSASSQQPASPQRPNVLSTPRSSCPYFSTVVNAGHSRRGSWTVSGFSITNASVRCVV